MTIKGFIKHAAQDAALTNRLNLAALTVALVRVGARGRTQPITDPAKVKSDGSFTIDTGETPLADRGTYAIRITEPQARFVDVPVKLQQLLGGRPVEVELPGRVQPGRPADPAGGADAPPVDPVDPDPTPVDPAPADPTPADPPARDPIKTAAAPQIDVMGRLVRAAGSQERDFAGFAVRIAFRTTVSVDGKSMEISAEQSLPLSGQQFKGSIGEPAKGSATKIWALYPDGTVAVTKVVSDAELSDDILLTVPAFAAPTIATDTAADAAVARRIRGKVVDITGQRQVSGEQVMLWGKAADGDTVPVVVAITDVGGNFAADYPRGVFVDAAATVTNSDAATPANAKPVNLSADGSFPEFVYIALNARPRADADDDDCGCHDGTEPPRQPDQADLVSNSSTYSQDIGDSCVNFTTPNRTLEEFSYCMAVRTTEPTIKGTTLSDLDERSATKNYYAPQTPVLMANRLYDDGGQAFTRMRTNAASDGGPELAESLRASAIPDIVSRIAVPQAASIIRGFDPDRIKAFAKIATGQEFAWKTAPGRAELDVRNSIDWDSTPTFYQATSIAHGHILHFKQVWKADGYSMGDLLYSLPLAPGQKKNIVVFDWDRTERAQRSEAYSEDEALDSYLSHNRDILDVVATSARERTDAHSSAQTSGQAGGVGGGIGVGYPPVFLGVAGGYAASSGSASSNASQSASRDVSGTALSQLRDNVQQSASAVRNQRATVVQTASQAERFKVQTETVANYNHCHAVTVQYFEILRHFAVHQELSHVQECLFIPLLMGEFDEEKAARWADLLRPRLRRGNRTSVRRNGSLMSLRNSPLEEGFDAIHRRLNFYVGTDLPNGSYADGVLIDLTGELSIELTLNRPQDKEDDAIDPLLWAPYLGLIGWSAPWVFNQYLKDRQQAERDRIFESEIAPQLAEEFVNTLRFSAIDRYGNSRDLPVDTTLISTYRRGGRLYCSIRPGSGAFSVRRSDIDRVVMWTDFDLSASANSRIIVRSGSMRYRTRHFNGMLFSNSAINNDLRNASMNTGGTMIPADNVSIVTPLTSEEMRDPRNEDAEKASELLTHLNANVEFYHKQIWLNMDPDRRFMLLDGFQAPNSGGRSVASVVENKVIGIAGNCLIMPVAPGYKLDPSYSLEPLLDVNGDPVRDEAGELVFKPTNLLDHYRPLTPVPPYRISLPTRGVFAEAVQGACNSCEKIDNSRFWRWEESPIPDSPTQIMPVDTNPPQRSDPGNLNPTPLPTPMINIQNAPNAPDPGAGLSGAFGVLNNGSLFRDMTGLAGNQNNALQATLSNQELAKHYADKATELAIQASAIKNGASNIDQIKQAMADGSISQAAGQGLIEDQLRAQVNGGKPDAPVNTAGQSKLAQVTADVVQSGKAVEASQSFADGTLASLKVSPPPAGTTANTIDFTVPGQITGLAQPSPDTCWAAVAAMMEAWKGERTGTVTVANEIARIGAPYDSYLANDVPLMQVDKNALTAKLGMIGDPIGLSSALPQSYLELMREYGPLWATVDGDLTAAVSTHAKLIYGIIGDGTVTGTKLRIIDPGNGQKIEQDFATFMAEFAQLAANAALPDGQIMRYSAKIGGEGASPRTVYDALTDLARPVSIGLTGDPSAKLLPAPSGVARADFKHQVTGGWNGASSVDATGLVTTGLKYPVDHGSHIMPMGVVDRLNWTNARVKIGANSYALPLNLTHLLASHNSTSPLTMNKASPMFPLKMAVQANCTLIFGYWVDTQTGGVAPIDLTTAPADGLDQWLKNGGASAATSSPRVAVLALYDLSLNGPGDDYSPTFGGPAPAMTARMFPMLSIWCASDADEVAADMTLSRPTKSAMAEDMMPGAPIVSSFYCDANEPLDSMWSDINDLVKMSLASGSISALLLNLLPANVTIPIAIAAMRLMPSVRWGSLFAHYKIDANLAKTTVVNRALGNRTNSTARMKMLDKGSTRVATSVTKRAGQAAFDNVHIAPDMEYDGAVAAMAPVCQHDCLHLHWRWSEQFPEVPTRGWANGKPHAVAGAPMIPENQDLAVSGHKQNFSYFPVAKQARAGEWQVFFHHGMAYVVELTWLGELLPLMEMTAADISLPSWASLYYHNRFWETGGSARSADEPRLDESKFGPLEAM